MLVLQYVLPIRFRRSRNFGLLHPNCRHRQRLALLRMDLRTSATVPGPAGMRPSAQPPLSERPKLQCRCCGAAMVIVRRRIAPWHRPVARQGRPVLRAREPCTEQPASIHTGRQHALGCDGGARLGLRDLHPTHPCNAGGGGNKSRLRQST